MMNNRMNPDERERRANVLRVYVRETGLKRKEIAKNLEVSGHFLNGMMSEASNVPDHILERIEG